MGPRTASATSTALSGLFVVQVGHGRQELAEVGAAAGRAARATSRSGATPTRRPSSWPPGWPSSRPATSTACSSPPAAPRRSSRRGSWPASTSAPIGQPGRYKVITRHTRVPRHHDGALAITGVARHRGAVRAAGARRRQRRQHEPLPACDRVHRARRRRPASAAPTTSSAAIVMEGPETVAAVFLEPVQNAGGCFTAAARLLRSGCARSATATACCSCPTRSSAPSAGSARWFGCERFGYQPDMITIGQGPHLGLRAARRRAASATGSPSRSSTDDAQLRPRHHLRRPPGELRGRAGQPRRLRDARTSSATCRANEDEFRSDARRRSRDLPDRRRRPRRRLLLRRSSW